MPRFIAVPSLGSGSFDICEIDADGVATRRLYIGYDRSASYKTGEDAARLLIMALSLPGGVQEATKIIRAQIIRTS